MSYKKTQLRRTSGGKVLGLWKTRLDLVTAES